MISDYITSSSKLLRIALHIFFWICVFAFYTFFYGRLSNNFYYSFVHLIYTSPLYIGATYITLYIIIPKFLLKKRYKEFVISSVYMVLGVAYLEILIIICLIVLPVNVVPLKWSAPINLDSLDIYLRLIGIYIVVFLASSIKLLKHWYTMQKKNQQLIKEKLEAELNMLKSQVHPHFLFNTLNNLYALTLKKSDKSPDVVLKLSDILDFMLYHSNKDFVELEREIKLVNNYIDLEKLRHSDRLQIDFEIDGDTKNKHIAPMVIFPLVENCFKHGAGSTNQKSWIKLLLQISSDSLNFTAENSKINKPAEKKGGLGLVNLRKRLDLIYPDNYELDIIETDSIFTATLNLSFDVKPKRLKDEDKMLDS